MVTSAPSSGSAFRRSAAVRSATPTTGAQAASPPSWSGSPDSTGRGLPHARCCRSRPVATPGFIPDTRHPAPDSQVIRAGGVDGPLSEDTLGGYQAAHQRPPAFGGSDGFAYSVAASVDESPGADGRYGADLLFVRWREGARPPGGPLATGRLASGATPGAAMRPLLSLTLREGKDHLERLSEASGERGPG